MGTMRNNFAGVFVLLLVLMLPTSQSFPHGKEHSSRRNSLANTLTPKAPSASTTYECLFVDENLPTCDVKWMLDEDEDSTDLTTAREKRDLNAKLDELTESRPRAKNVDASSMTRVIVYTFEGCIPPIRHDRLHFLMPLCEGIALDKIVGVERFYPFAVKGVKNPPFVFPEVTHDQWLRMKTRLGNHVSSNARNKKHRTAISAEAAINKTSHGRTDELMRAATTKETMPNAIVANTNVSNGSSSRGPIRGSWSKPAASTGTERRIIGEIEHNESPKSYATASIENTSRDHPRIPSDAWSRNGIAEDRGNEMESRPRKKSRGHSRWKIPNKADRRREMTVVDRKKSSTDDKNENLDAIPAPPLVKSPRTSIATNRVDRKKMAVDEPGNHDDSKHFLKPLLDTRTEDRGIVNGSNDLLTEEQAIEEEFRRKRDIRLREPIDARRNEESRSRW
ncbi:uncharacterized protein LOC143342344 [Colletes latitarsis]|uniref:uncharacterized protein LOC143342344 n=1 Tax=Colletes latitarsis TaxID=2605962 RepID=UPI0040359744